ncbi:hypothetical protein KR009_006802, partial [Drosophila setifemur]
IIYGDLNVNIGEPFSITCIIPITERIHWLRNGESISRHNLRHGRDDHSYVLTESPIEGEKHRMEAHLSVRHALKVHEGRYQCNHHHGSSHMLHVRDSKGQGEPTESGYQTIDGLTPNSAEDLFTRTWMEVQQQKPQQQLPQMPHQSHKQHKSHGNSNLSNAMPWHPSAGGGADGTIIHRVYSATPPDFPPPRLNPLEHTVAPPEPPTILYNQTRQQRPIQIATATGSDSDSDTESEFITTARATEASLLLTTAHHHSHHQQQLQQQAQHTLNAFQLPLPTRTNVQPSPGQNLSPIPGQNEKYQTYSPHYVPPVVGGGGQPARGVAGGELTTISTATSTRPMKGVNGAGGVRGGAAAAGGGSGGGATMMLGAINHMMGGQVQHSQTLVDDKVVPNYDNPEHQMKFYDIRGPLLLSCNVSDTDSKVPLIWKKNGTDVMQVNSLKGRIKVIDAERSFMIDKTETHDDGVYSCEFGGVTKTINVIARVVVRVPSNTAVVEGEKMSVSCSVVGTAPQLSWTFGNVTLTNNTDRFVLKSENNIQNAILTLDNVTLEDRGDYKCIGRNAANDYGGANVASDVTLVRVKGKFAALWPFLGICAEVLILCIIILIYEKRRNKSELEESDTDPQEQ